ncbi:MAG: PPC domain-containing protein, partial [Planctomycetes bacterium]|nr:PPC domain-containing protein [Planctomycetota bacterium]
DLTTRADMDFFQVVVPSGSDGTLTVSLDARNLSLLAPKLAVYDSAGNLVAIADAGSAYGSVVTISLSGLVAGQRYTLMVDGASSDAFGMGGYRLNLQFGGIIVTPPGLNPDRYEPNDLWATANDFGRINSLSQTGLTLHSSSDVDYYTFVARSSATFNVSILFSQASGNLDLTVYDASGNVLASGTSQSDNESVSLSLVSGQRYYLKVASPGGDQNGYDLLVQKIGSSSASSKGSQKGGKASAEEELGHGTELGADTMPILQAVDNPQNRRDLSRTQGLAEIPVAPAPFAQSDPLSGVRGVMVAPLQAPRQEAERFRKADRVLEQWDDWDWDGLLDGLAKVVIRSP